jgi:coenzyme F420-reducing hydrogenase delta subunit/Pyruvate/2-oxoacid:ferredoxin oxidoreductase delta subunit
MLRRAGRWARRGLALLDAALNRLYGWRYNPLYQSGSLVVVLLVVLLVTGVYLLVFYRLSAPYESIVRLQEQWWGGRWIRALHRYAADAALPLTGVHALRMLLQRRSWGPRALAWLSGVFLLALILVSGWTGYVMVWDAQALQLAAAGARLFDALPIFAAPIVRTFVGERPIPSAFFFLNLFAHIALPVGLLLVLWVHVARVARPTLWPGRALRYGSVGALILFSLIWPAALGDQADLLLVSGVGGAPYDLWYSWWLPLAAAVSPIVVWGVGATIVLAVLLVPIVTRPPAATRPSPSVVDERLCTGCEQCYLDCPYEAITMVARSDGRSTLVARVDPDLCTSCGICAGSCAPMGVGPPGRTGRDQLRTIKAVVAAEAISSREIVVLACERSAGLWARATGCRTQAVSCGGNLHSSVIEFMVRSGAAAVLVVACPPRDCWNREGTVWLEQRMYHEREAELQARVDRARVKLVYASPAETSVVTRALEELRADVERLESSVSESSIDLVALCEASSAAESLP